MAHMVLGYPTGEHSLQIAAGLADGGAAALELQIPFSDPIADGSVIERACHVALQNGARTAECLELARRIVRTTRLPCYCMSYVTVPFRIGIDRFVQRVADAGLCALIVPDLPFDTDEGLYDCCVTHGIEHVVVSVLTVAPERFNAITALPQQTIYMALRGGITGEQTTLTPSAIARLQQLQRSGKRILAGFGIRNAHQITQLSPYVMYTVVGSHFVRHIDAAMRKDANVDYRAVATQAMRALLDRRQS